MMRLSIQTRVLNVAKAVGEKFGEENVRHDQQTAKNSTIDFPLLMQDDHIASALADDNGSWELLLVAFDYVFVNRDQRDEAAEWLRINRDSIIKP